MTHETNSTIHKLPAIKIQLDNSILNKYDTHKKIQSEISKIKEINLTKIKFISKKENLILIATDDANTHHFLQDSWPEHAFEGKSTIIKPKERPTTSTEKQQTKYKLLLLDVDLDIEMDDDELNNLLFEINCKEPKRILNKSKQPTKTIEIEANDQASYEAARKKTLSLYYKRINCTTPEKPINQCFKCQLTGHSQHKCKNGSRCLRCGGQHDYKKEGKINCTSNYTKCVNCNGEHFACARSCPYLKNNNSFSSLNPESKKQQGQNQYNYYSTRQLNQNKSSPQPLMNLNTTSQIQTTIKNEIAAQIEII